MRWVRWLCLRFSDEVLPRMQSKCLLWKRSVAKNKQLKAHRLVPFNIIQHKLYSVRWVQWACSPSDKSLPCLQSRCVLWVSSVDMKKQLKFVGWCRLTKYSKQSMFTALNALSLSSLFRPKRVACARHVFAMDVRFEKIFQTLSQKACRVCKAGVCYECTFRKAISKASSK